MWISSSSCCKRFNVRLQIIDLHQFVSKLENMYYFFFFVISYEIKINKIKQKVSNNFCEANTVHFHDCKLHLIVSRRTKCPINFFKSHSIVSRIPIYVAEKSAQSFFNLRLTIVKVRYVSQKRGPPWNIGDVT